MADEHVIEALGKTKITVRDKKVVDVGEPQIDYCPIFAKHRGIKKFDKESIKDNIQFRIDDFGMCTPDRVLEMDDFLSFGVSEIISTLISDEIVDCAIMVLEGAGTVLVKNSKLAQGVGGRVSGLVSTTPINEVISNIGEENVLNPENAEINQVEGVKKAISQGYKNIAVSVVSSEDAKKIRELANEDINIYIFAVHVTGLSYDEAEALFDYCDIVTSCASLNIRKIAEERDVFSVGASIPIYASNEIGEDFINRRLEKIGGMKKKKSGDIPNPLV